MCSFSEALLGRGLDGQPLPNGAPGYYNSLGKTTYSTSPSSCTSSLIPSVLQSSLPASSHISQRNSLHMSTTPPGICSRSPLSEDYSTNYSSTLPRTRLGGLTRLQESEIETCGISGFKSGLGGLKGNSERFSHMSGETKANPKYVIRTRISESKDESFVWQNILSFRSKNNYTNYISLIGTTVWAITV